MNVYKVSARQVYGTWHDFNFVTASNHKDALLSALHDMEIPEGDDRITFTVFQENPINKRKK